MMTEFQLRKIPYRTQLIFVGLILIIGFSRYIPLSHPEWLNFSPVLSLFLMSGAMLRGAWSWIAPICRGLRYRFASQSVLWIRLLRAFHARHRLFILPDFPHRKNACKNKKPWNSGRGRSSGSFCFPHRHLFFRLVEQPCIRKNPQWFDSGYLSWSTRLSSRLSFPQEFHCQLHSFYFRHRMGRLANPRTGSVYCCGGESRRSELTNGQRLAFEGPLAIDLEQANACGNRGVETVHLSGHRNMNKQITIVRGKPPDPLPSAPTTNPIGPLRSASKSDSLA